MKTTDSTEIDEAGLAALAKAQEEYKAKEAELAKKSESWKGVGAAVDYILEGNAKELFDSFLKDFTLQSQPPKNDQDQPKKTPGISFGSIFKAIGFAIAHPTHTWNLVKAARSGVFKDPDYQRNLVASDKLWSFIGKTSEKLPQIGRVLDGFGVEIFKEGKILDAQALMTLKGALTDPIALEAAKGIAVATMAPKKDWTKVTSEALGLLAQNASFKQYFQEKGPSIRDYVKDLANETPAITGSLETYRVDSKFFDQIPAILNNFPQLQQIWDAMQKEGVMFGAEKALEMLANDESLHKFFKENPSFLPDIARGVIASTPSLSAITEGYKLDTQILNIAGTMLTDPDLASALVGDYNKKDYMELTDKLIGALGNREFGLGAELQKHARDGLFDKLVEGVLGQNKKSILDRGGDVSESLESKLEVFGIGAVDLPKITKIFPILLDSPDDLRKVFGQFRKGDYAEMGKELIALSARNPAIKAYMNENSILFDKIIFRAVGVPETLQEQLANAPRVEGQKNPNITDIFQILMNSENQEKLNHLLDLYKKGEMVGLIKETCHFMETDKTFAEYLNANKENFALIINAVVDKAPAIKTWTAGAELGSLVSAILKDPSSVRKILEGYGGGAVAVAAATAKVLVEKAMDSEFRSAFAGAVFGIAKGWIVGGGTDKQKLVDGILQAVSSRDDPRVQLNLSKFLQQGIEKEEGGQDQKLIELLSKKILFDGVSIQGESGEPLNLGNLKIDGTSFVNSTFSSVSFKDTKFKGVSFNGATLLNVNFSSAEMDAATLTSMIPQLRLSKIKLASTEIGKESYGINLSGVKITGDLSNVDLSGISLEGADLSGITSMKNVDLKGVNLRETNLDPKLLVETYNLDKAIPMVATEILIAQKENLVSRVAQTISRKTRMPEDSTRALATVLKALSESKSDVGSRVRAMLESRPADIWSENFPVDPFGLKHTSDSIGKTSRLLTLLHEHRDDPGSISRALVAQIMADQVTEAIFGKGDNRGQDAALIERAMQRAMEKFANDNPDIDSITLLENPKSKEVLELITQKLRDKSHNTKFGIAQKVFAAGLVEGGLQISKEVFNDELVLDIATKMDANLGGGQLDKAQLEIIEAMSQEIGGNLFGDGANKRARKEEVGHILSSLKQAFVEMKRSGVDINQMLANEGLVGGVDGKWRTGLTQLYSDNCKSTVVGNLTGGVQLDKTKIDDAKFIGDIKKVAESNARLNYQEQIAIQYIARGIGENLFKEGATSDRANDTGYIYDTLSEVFAQIKKEKGGVGLSEVIRGKAEEICGESKKNFWGLVNGGTGLTGAFYEKTNNTKAAGLFLKKESAFLLIPSIKGAMDKQVGGLATPINTSVEIHHNVLKEAKTIIQNAGVVEAGGPHLTRVPGQAISAGKGRG